MGISVWAAGIFLEAAAALCSLAGDGREQYAACRDFYVQRVEEARQARTAEVGLTPVEETAEAGDGYFTFGQMKISLWDGVTAELRSTDGEREAAQKYVQEVDLHGTCEEYGLPPRILFSRYELQWDSEDPAQEKALLHLLLEQMGEGEDIRCILRRGKQKIYLADSEYRRYYVLIQGKDLYQVGWFWPEEDYGFDALLQEGRVSWLGEQDTVIWPKEEQRLWETSYFIVKQPDGNTPLLHYTGEGRIEVYREGRYELSAQFLTYGERRGDRGTEDMNFDGCPDLYTGYYYGQIFLWDPEEELFAEAQMPERWYTVSNYLFPEQKAVWLYDVEYGDVDPVVYKETLYRWEESTLEAVRSCTLEVRGEQVHVYVSEGESGPLLLEQDFDGREWERHPETVRPLYERFYEGIVPREAYSLRHEMETEQKYIDRELLERLTESLLRDELEETVEALETGRRLTEEQAGEIAREDAEVRLEIESVHYSGGHSAECNMILTDADNDGIEDILSEEYFGGSGGFEEWVFLKGQPDGGYVRTSAYTHEAEWISVIRYKGRNYLCRIGYSGEDRRCWGFDLYCYENGSRVEKAVVRLRPQECRARVVECTDKTYEELAVNAGEKFAEVYEYVIGNRMMTGSAEQKIPDERNGFQCDLDNDGVPEFYRKSFWIEDEYREWLSFSCKDNAFAGSAVYETADPVMMWVEEYGGENIVLVMYRTGFLKFEIAGYRIGSDGYETVFVTECIPVCGAEQQIQRQIAVPDSGASFGG